MTCLAFDFCSKSPSSFVYAIGHDHDDAALAILVGAACSSEGLFLRLGSMRWLSPHGQLLLWIGLEALPDGWPGFLR